MFKTHNRKGEPYIMDSDTEPTKAQWTPREGTKAPEIAKTFVRHAWFIMAQRPIYVAYHGCLWL
jgi:hypothetical protein